MAAVSTATKVAAIFGAGGGLGWSVAKAFAAAGYNVAVSRRNAEDLRSMIDEEASSPTASQFHAFPCDVTDQEAVSGVLSEIQAKLGTPDVVVVNQGSFTKKPFAEISKQEFDDAIRTNLWGSFTVAQEASKQMTGRGSGTIIVTGATASLRGSSGFSLVSMPKAAMRSMAQSMARELGPHGIHVAHVIVDGIIWGPRTADWGIPKEKTMEPDAVAEEYVHLAQQRKSAWTHELDLRPHDEKW